MFHQWCGRFAKAVSHCFVMGCTAMTRRPSSFVKLPLQSSMCMECKNINTGILSEINFCPDHGMCSARRTASLLRRENRLHMVSAPPSPCNGVWLHVQLPRLPCNPDSLEGRPNSARIRRGLGERGTFWTLHNKAWCSIGTGGHFQPLVQYRRPVHAIPGS